MEWEKMINSFEFGVEGCLTNQTVFSLTYVFLKNKTIYMGKVNLHSSIR